MYNSQSSSVPLELYDLSTYSKAVEFGKAVGQKVLQTASTLSYNADESRNVLEKRKIDPSRIAAFTREILGLVEDPNEIDNLLKVVDCTQESYLQRLREALAQAANKQKRRGILNTSEGADSFDDSEDDTSETGAKKQNAIISSTQTPVTCEVTEEIVEFDMEELERLAELKRVADEEERKKESEREKERLEEERCREEFLKTFQSQKREVSNAIPQGFTVLSKGDVKKNKGKRR